ncbi:unnamed protein product, partial [Ectocarpus sp. 12 AP-2014]
SSASAAGSPVVASPPPTAAVTTTGVALTVGTAAATPASLAGVAAHPALPFLLSEKSSPPLPSRLLGKSGDRSPLRGRPPGPPPTAPPNARGVSLSSSINVERRT